MQLKQYGKLKVSVVEFGKEDVLTGSGEGTIVDSYNDGWKNPFYEAEVYND